ncbi:MAG TPA: GIY-YIG nuclease family protein [Polyangiaceae bacterium]
MHPGGELQHDDRLLSPRRRLKSTTSRWFVYVARCADSTLYVGVARDVASRIEAHNAGRGAKYTRGRGPVRAIAVRACACQGDALRLERALKRLPRARKLELAASLRALGAFARAVAAKRRSDAR